MKRFQYLFLWLCWSAGVAAQCPVLPECTGAVDTFPALDTNNPFFWASVYYFDSINQLHDLAEAPVDLQFSVIDTCSSDSVEIAYALELDLDGDGACETLVHSDDQTPWTNWVNFDNLNGPGYPATFDDRPVDGTDSFFFKLALESAGDTLSARICWSQPIGQNYCSSPLYLPLGRHRIRWIVRYGTTADTCVREFVVRDAAAPVVECPDILTVPLNNNTGISLWASDFILSVTDNITPDGAIPFAIIQEENSLDVFPYHCDGNPNTSITLNCLDLGLNVVQVWATDLSGNVTYCLTNLLLTDQMGNCNGFNGVDSVPVCVKTEINDPVSNVVFSIEGNNPSLPPLNLFFIDTTGNDGCWQFPQSLPVSGSYLVIPEKDINPLNGVTTFDLLLMSKHVLGLEILPTPFRLLAADINRSNSVTTFDILELRKLILGINQFFPNNDSWRFVNKSYVFTDLQNPWTAPGSITLSALLDCSQDFIGIKVGDLNLSANPAGVAGPADDRGPARQLFLPDRRLQAGETVDVPLRLPGNTAWAGAQFALRFDPTAVVVETVTPGDMPELSEENYVLFPDRLHLSWIYPAGANGQTLLRLRIRAQRPCRLSEVFSLDNHFLHAEAYTAAATQHDLVLACSDDAPTPRAYPNPTQGAAFITLSLPQAETVQLRVSDAAGKLLYEKATTLEAGDNTLDIPAVVTVRGGVFFWQVELGGGVYAGRLLRW